MVRWTANRPGWLAGRKLGFAQEAAASNLRGQATRISRIGGAAAGLLVSDSDGTPRRIRLIRGIRVGSFLSGFLGQGPGHHSGKRSDRRAPCRLSRSATLRSREDMARPALSLHGHGMGRKRARLLPGPRRRGDRRCGRTRLQRAPGVGPGEDARVFGVPCVAHAPGTRAAIRRWENDGAGDLSRNLDASVLPGSLELGRLLDSFDALQIFVGDTARAGDGLVGYVSQGIAAGLRAAIPRG